MSAHAARVPTILSRGHAFLEGVRWHEGSVYASDFFKHRVLRWPGGGGPPETVVEVPQQPSGLGWMPDGDLLVVSMLDRKLMRRRGEELVEVGSLWDIAGWNANDMVVDEAGRAYIGNFGWDEATYPEIESTKLARVDPDGTVTVLADDMICPNGMAIAPDGRTLFVNETFAARVTAFDRDPADGSVSNRRVWAAFSDVPFATVPEALAAGVILPDGMTLDAEGALWLGDCHGAGAHRVVEGGEVIDFVPTDDHATFTVALGGEDLQTLFLCTTFPYGAGDPSQQHEGTMRACRVDVPGVGSP
jgi:sugar lactone lactonase YvrE